MRQRNPYLPWLELATPSLWAEGLLWYREANTFAQALADETGITLQKSAGVVSALSASTRWSQTKNDAEALCQSYALGKDMYEVTLHTYGKQCEKARNILDTQADIRLTAVLELLGRRAFKTRAFLGCIFDPTGEKRPFWRPVCIDRHMISAAGLDSKWTQGAKGCYDTLVGLVIEAAEAFDVRPCEAQAIVWVTFLARGKALGSIDPKDIDDGSDIPI